MMRILYGQDYAETTGFLDRLYELLSKLSILGGSGEMVLKSGTKVYNVNELDAAEATKSMLKAASGYDQIEQSAMVKQGVVQDKLIIMNLEQALAGIERTLGTGGGGGGGEGVGGGGGNGGNSSGGDEVGFGSPMDFDNPFI